MLLLIVLILFGPKKLPELGSSLGRGMKSFKDSLGGTEPNDPGSDGDPAPSATLGGALDPVDPARPTGSNPAVLKEPTDEKRAGD